MNSVNEEVAKRSEYTAGLRKLADLLDRTPEIPLPDHGDTVAISWFLTAERSLTKAREVLNRIPGWKRAYDFVSVSANAMEVAWRTRYEGVLLEVMTRADVVPRLDGARDRSDQSSEAKAHRIRTRRFGEGLR